jgi:hypothetical protein
MRAWRATALRQAEKGLIAAARWRLWVADRCRDQAAQCLHLAERLRERAQRRREPPPRS